MSRKADQQRSRSGNMIIVTVAFLFVLVILAFFGYNYVHLLGGNQGQQSAIQSAALVVGQDFSRIVINTPEFGYVSLSDAAPIGQATSAGDKFYLPVRSVNTLIGTARLDYIIGDKLNGQSANTGDVISNMATRDLNLIYTKVVPALKKVLNDSIQPGGTATDINGNTITPYADAVAAYQQNLKRSGSGQISYIPNTMKLTLGCLSQGSGVTTNIIVPQPTGTASVNSSLQQNGYYLSESNITYSGYNDSAYGGAPPFVFASVGAAIRLVDQSKWVLDNGLAVQVPAVVKVEADQTTNNSQAQNITTHVIACASPASTYDPRPAPGALSASFPDGIGSDIACLQDVVGNTNLLGISVNTALRPPPSATTGFSNLETPSGGDYPNDAGSLMQPMNWMLGSAPPSMADVWHSAFYDWLRRAGVKANIDSVLQIQLRPFILPPGYKPMKDWVTLTSDVQSPPGVDVTTTAPGGKIPNGFMNIFVFNSDGTIKSSAANCYPLPYQVLSQNQMYAEAVNANPSPVPIVTFPNPPNPPNFLFPKTTTTSDSTDLLGVRTKVTQTVGMALTFSTMYDVYVRDEVRQPGTILGGKHGGEPLDNSQTSSLTLRNKVIPDGQKGLCQGPDLGGGGLGADHQGGIGNGAMPLLTVQSDFAELQTGDPVPTGTGTMYDTYATGSGIRPTYTQNGTCVDIRFRRQVDIKKFTQTSTTVTPPLGVGVTTTTTAMTTELGYVFFEF